MTAECSIRYVIRTRIDFPEIQRKRTMLLIGRLHLFLLRANIRGLYKVMKFFDIIMEEARKYFSRRDMIYLLNHWHRSMGEAISIVGILLANSGIMPGCLFLPRFPVWRLKNCDTCHGNLPLRHVFYRIFMFAFGFVFAIRSQTESHLF